MTTIKHIHALIQQAEQQLALLDKEEQQREGKPLNYMFVYEQAFQDEWKPNHQSVEAHDIEEAFSVFGHVLKAYGISVRNIRYGLWNDMKEEYERIYTYWEEQRRIANAQAKKERETN